MNICPEAIRLKALQSKGGVMFFTIEKLDKLYRGMVLLSSVQNHYRKRIVCMKVYRVKLPYGITALCRYAGGDVGKGDV